MIWNGRGRDEQGEVFLESVLSAPFNRDRRMKWSEYLERLRSGLEFE
jgi:hypothetical protein